MHIKQRFSVDFYFPWGEEFFSHFDLLCKHLHNLQSSSGGQNWADSHFSISTYDNKNTKQQTATAPESICEVNVWIAQKKSHSSSLLKTDEKRFSRKFEFEFFSKLKSSWLPSFICFDCIFRWKYAESTAVRWADGQSTPPRVANT